MNFNSTPLLERCLASLEASTIADGLEVIVVDNASQDFDVKAALEKHPGVAFLPQDRNLTVTGGNNVAFRRATADLVLMLNPDTRVEESALERAVGHMASAGIAGLGATLIGTDGELQRYYRRLPDLGDLPVLLFEPMFRQTSRGRRYLMLDEEFGDETDVPQPPGAFFLFRRRDIESDLLDSQFFNYMCDVELCERIGAKGPVKVFADVRCFHVGSAAGTGTTNPTLRLRLYQDLAWGVRRYFLRGRPSQLRVGVVWSLLIGYWITRVLLTVSRDWRTLPTALKAAGNSLSGGPPRY